MARKFFEDCPNCGAQCMPIDKAVAFSEQFGDFPVKLWRYVCGKCEWVWANKAQREHNAEVYRRARRDAKANVGWSWN